MRGRRGEHVRRRSGQAWRRRHQLLGSLQCSRTVRYVPERLECHALMSRTLDEAVRAAMRPDVPGLHADATGSSWRMCSIRSRADGLDEAMDDFAIVLIDECANFSAEDERARPACPAELLVR